MESKHKPSIIIREDVRTERSPQTSETNDLAKSSRSERITRRALNKKLQDTQPASVLSPVTITRADTSAILKRIFAQEPPAKETAAAPAQSAGETRNETAGEMNSPQLWQFAYYYQTIPAFNPFSPPQDAAKNAESLIQYLQYGLQKLKIPMPKLIAENSEKLKKIVVAYDTEYMRLIKTSPEAINDLYENLLRNPQVTALCTDLINDLKRFGQDVYGELAEMREKEERLAVLESPAGRQIQMRYPLLGQQYEAAPDKLETAKKDYLKRLRDSIAKDIATSAWDYGKNPEINAQFPPENVTAFISSVIFDQMCSLVDGLKLSLAEKTEIMESLPSTINNYHIDGETNVYAVFGTDKPIPARLGAEFERTVTQAMLKSKLFSFTAFDHEDHARRLIWHYAAAVQNGLIRTVENPDPAITLKYQKDPASCRFLTDENFFGPVSEQDERFLGQLLALIQKNGKAEQLKTDLQTGIQNQQSGSKTFVAYGLLADVQRSFLHTLDHLNAPSKKEGSPQTSEMPPPRQFQTLQEAIEFITDLRAYSVSALKENHAAIAQKDASSDALRLNHLHSLQEAHEETRRAKNEAKTSREQIRNWLTSLKGETGIFSRGIRNKIDQILAQISELEKKG